MTTIRFHRVDNTDYGRCHSPWFKKFAEYCEQYFTVEWVNYAQASSQGIANIQLQTSLPHFGNTPPLSDVDCVIENLDTQKFVVLTFTEYFNSFVVHYLRSDMCQKLLSAHYSHHNMYYWLKRDNLLHKFNNVSPWFFGMFEHFDVDHYRNVRTHTDVLNPTLFYKGSGQGYREVVNILHERQIVDRSSVPFHTYLDQLATTKLALSYYMDLDKYSTPYDHPGEFCYRDMEYVALGVPFMRIEYTDAVYNGFVPNYHYATIKREHAYTAYANGGNIAVADLIQEKYGEFIQDDDLLNFISFNSKTWFDTYARWPNNADLTLQLTGMNLWI